MDYIPRDGGGTAVFKVDRARGFSIVVNRREGLEGEYFILCDNPDYASARRACRISMREPAYLAPSNWILGGGERRALADCLSAPSLTGASVWRRLIAACNLEKPGDAINEDDTVRNLAAAPAFPDHLPIDLPMPDYLTLPDVTETNPLLASLARRAPLESVPEDGVALDRLDFKGGAAVATLRLKDGAAVESAERQTARF